MSTSSRRGVAVRKHSTNASSVDEDGHDAVDDAALAQLWVLAREHEVDQFLDVTHRRVASTARATTVKYTSYV